AIVKTKVPAGNDCPVDEKASPVRYSVPSISMNLRWEASTGQTSKVIVPFVPYAVTEVVSCALPGVAATVTVLGLRNERFCRFEELPLSLKSCEPEVTLPLASSVNVPTEPRGV